VRHETSTVGDGFGIHVHIVFAKDDSYYYQYDEGEKAMLAALYAAWKE